MAESDSEAVSEVIAVRTGDECSCLHHPTWRELKMRSRRTDLLVSFLLPRLDRQRLHFAFKLVHLHVQRVYRVLGRKQNIRNTLLWTVSISHDAMLEQKHWSFLSLHH